MQPIHGHLHRDRCDTCRDWPDWAREILAALEEMGTLMTGFASDQAHLDADVHAIGQQFATVIAELKAQHDAGQPLDFTAADALVASVTAEATADAPAPPVETASPVEGDDSKLPADTGDAAPTA